MKIVRLFSFIILIGAYLSADSNSGNLPAPIPIDFGEGNGIRIESTNCDSCNTLYDIEAMGASCCDEATIFNSIFTCEVLEGDYLWNCSGCTCPSAEDDDWTTDFGCMDMDACNYDPDVMYHYQGTCLSSDECGVCDGDGSDDQGCGCFEPGPSGCDNACGSTLEDIIF